VEKIISSIEFPSESKDVVRLMRNRYQKDVDFCVLKVRMTAIGIIWLGYWCLRSSGKVLGEIDEIRIHAPEDWSELQFLKN
jgi:hypothetical protein